jgi:ribonuclease HI
LICLRHQLSTSTCSILTAEIAVITAALSYTQESFEPEPPKFPFGAQRLRVAIFSDSQYALRAIQAGNNARTRRFLLKRISESFHALYEEGIDVEFRWVPGHAEVCGNTEADEAARAATG